MITLISYIPYFAIWLLALAVGGILTDYFNWWGW
jgi:hypothetical protein